jgi:hypothetical protein
MTDDELSDFVQQHPDWSETRKLAFVMANMEFDEATERRRIAKKMIDGKIARGELVGDGHVA